MLLTRVLNEAAEMPAVLVSVTVAVPLVTLTL